MPDIMLDSRTITVSQGADAYLIDDVEYDRISRVLDIIAKPGLDKWKREKGFIKADEIMRESQMLGKHVHAMVEEFNRGKDPWNGFWFTETNRPIWLKVNGDRLEPYYRGYAQWFEQRVRQVIMIERTVWSPTHGYAGTFDTFAELKGRDGEYDYEGKLALLDNKTSKYLSWVYRLQLAAYELAALEQELIPDVDLRGIVFLSSKTPGTCRLVPYAPDTYLRDRAVWLGTLDLYRMGLEYEDDWKQRG